MSRFCLALGIAVMAALAPLAGACLAVENSRGLARRIEPLIRAHKGDVAVVVKHLETGESFAHRADARMPTASLIKVAVMIEAYRQAEDDIIELSRMVELSKDDKVPGSGILTRQFSPGVRMPLRDAVRLMMAYSDNTATNLVLNQIGLKQVGETMAKLGAPNTRIYAKVFRRDTTIDAEKSREFGLGSTTAKEMASLLERIHLGEIVSKTASAEMRDHLLSCEDKTRLVRFLPDGVKLAHKTGAVSRVRCDAGLMYAPSGPVAVCVLTANNEDRSWKDDNAANLLCARIGKTVHDHFERTIAKKPSAPKTLKSGDSGRLVEDLQRTLNARLEPSPELAVDGDYGPMTVAAVKRFQESNKLNATGEVEAETWRALGPLLKKGPPVPDPDVVNGAKLARSPLADLNSPPLVTCKAWAIGDENGKLLWGVDADKRLNFASTTKIMTAYVVLKFAEKNPEVLKEIIEFSRRADETRGSTSGLRAGERLSVEELLYGLLLPSGNDASVALAEHFGPRLAQKAAPKKPADSEEAAAKHPDPLRQFVTEMNRTAQQLKMKNTTYRNPHGLTEEGHLSSAADLLRLATAARALPSFRKYVGTRQRGCRVQSRAGYTRNVIWKNTNRLLAIEGFDGLKTGTTSAAGACLVSSGVRNGDRLMVVVLGSANSAARYVDARNLYHWGWRQRED